MKSAAQIRELILDFLKKAWKSKSFDYLLAPVQIPSGESFSYVLMQEQALLDDTCPLPPVIPVSGAKAVSHITKKGQLEKICACVMYPCEIRAAIELYKLGQLKLDNILLLSLDCPGVLPLATYISNPVKGKEEFNNIIQEWGNDSIRPVCKTCLYFGDVLGDLHIGIMENNNDICIIPGSDKGEAFLKNLDMSVKKSTAEWENKIKKIKSKREDNQKKADLEFKANIQGMDKLKYIFSTCIGCHNCMSVCPICYCRLCYFNSDNIKHETGDYIKRAISKGSLTLPGDTLLFHSGRMSHMSLSCIGCGSCEDACPVSIPVAQIFKFIARENQRLFQYTAGIHREEKPPLVVYKEDELSEFEDTH